MKTIKFFLLNVVLIISNAYMLTAAQLPIFKPQQDWPSGRQMIGEESPRSIAEKIDELAVHIDNALAGDQQALVAIRDIKVAHPELSDGIMQIADSIDMITRSGREATNILAQPEERIEAMELLYGKLQQMKDVVVSEKARSALDRISSNVKNYFLNHAEQIQERLQYFKDKGLSEYQDNLLAALAKLKPSVAAVETIAQEKNLADKLQTLKQKAEQLRFPKYEPMSEETFREKRETVTVQASGLEQASSEQLDVVAAEQTEKGSATAAPESKGSAVKKNGKSNGKVKSSATTKKKTNGQRTKKKVKTTNGTTSKATESSKPRKKTTATKQQKTSKKYSSSTEQPKRKRVSKKVVQQ